MDQISLAWVHYPNTKIFTVMPSGITLAQLHHHAHPCGFMDFQTEDGEPLLVGYSREQKDALRHSLEAAGHEFGDEQFSIALSLDLYASDDEVSL